MIRPISEGDAWVTNDDGDIIGIQLHGRSEVVDLSNPVNGKVDPVTGGVKLLAGQEIDYSYLDTGRRPAPYKQLIGAVKVNSSCGAIGAGNWVAGTNTTLALDAVNCISDANAIELTAISLIGVDGKMTKTLGASVDISSTAPTAWIRARFYVAPAQMDKVDYISTGFFDANGFSRIYYQWYTTPYGKSGWNEMYIPISQQSYSGGVVNLAAVTKLYLAVTPKVGQTAKVTFDDLTIFTPKTTRTNGRIMIGFDGTYSQQATAVAYMAKKGLPVTLATNGKYLDVAGRLTSAQLKAMSKSAAFVMCYAGALLGEGSKPWAAMTDDEKMYVINKARKWAIANGYHSGARMLSISGVSGWTAENDAWIGKYLDFVTGGDMTGTKYQQLMLEGPYGTFSWWNGQATTTRNTMNFTNLCAEANATRGTIVYWCHLNGASNDNLANLSANVDIAIAAGLEFITPLDFVVVR